MPRGGLNYALSSVAVHSSTGLLRHSKPACRAMTANGEMDEDHRELIRGLFSAATAHLETAHETAIDGQSGFFENSSKTDFANAQSDSDGSTFIPFFLNPRCERVHSYSSKSQ